MNSENRIILLMNSERCFSPKILNQFLTKTESKIEKIFIFPAFNQDDQKKKQFIKASLRIMGGGYFIQYCLKSLLAFLIEFSPLPLKIKKNFSLKATAQYFNIPYAEYLSVNSLDLIEEITKEKYNIGLSTTSQIYGSGILSIPFFTLYNFHPSLLPRNKGKFPIFWAFYNQEKEQGMTCHQINTKIDDGQIIFQKLFKIHENENENVETVLNQYMDQLPSYFNEAIDRIQSQNYCSLNRDYVSFYGPIPNREQIKKYHQIVKNRFIDKIQKKYDSKFYPYLISFITALNVFIFILPAEAILVGGILAKPHSWKKMAFFQTIAASLSTLLLGGLVYWKGYEVIHFLSPDIELTKFWIGSTSFMKEWGLYALTIMCILPVPILPGIAFSIFSNLSIVKVVIAVILGRWIKFYALCYVVSFFPHLFLKKN